MARPMEKSDMPDTPLISCDVELGYPHKIPKDTFGVSMPWDWRFWCIILSLGMCMLLTAIDFAAIGNALPIIVNDLHGKQFMWVGSAYTLAATAPLPFCSGLAQVFGRRAVMLGSLLFFCVGSAVCGAAPNMNTLIAGRTIQGLGAGGIVMLIRIILGDIVPLHKRGTFNGIVGLAWTIGGGAGPVIGGALAERGQWRWLFFLNIPICIVAGLLVSTFLRLRTPTIDLREKLDKLDWTGNLLIMLSTISVVVGLSWGGVQFPWTSVYVLTPLVIGFVGMCGFIVYEALFSAHPILPMTLMADRTALSGYMQNFLMGIIFSSLSYWLPIYFQACKGASPIASGVDGFGLSFTISPISIITGIVINKTGKYRPKMWIAWVLVVLGCSLLSTLDANSSRSKTYCYEIVTGIGLGIIYVAAYFPILAPIPVTQNAPAMALYTFFRNFSFVWGVTIGGVILQNQLTHKLSPEFLAKFSQDTEIAFSIIPTISQLPQPLRDEVRDVFASALQVVWKVLTGLAAIGSISSLAMQSLPLHTTLDQDWGREEIKGAKEVEQ